MSVLRQAIVDKRPLVHHLTNYVTAGFCADMALAIGASPVMADELQEMGEMTGKADALVLNIGTINAGKFAAMERAAQVARKRRIPVVLDPVGVMATEYRLNCALKLLAEGVTILRGNLSECSALASAKAEGKGVDAVEETELKATELAPLLAQQFSCVVAITGAKDVISDGAVTWEAKNGDAMLSSITGTGCMTTTLTGAAAGATDNYLAAAIFGLTAMNIAGERAAQRAHGPGSFRSILLDEIHALTGEDLENNFQGARI